MFFQFDKDTRINYEINGNGNQTILFLHGYGTSLESFRDIQPFIEKSFRMVMVDLRGYGKSTKPIDDKYTASFQADIIKSLVKHLELNNFVIAGHSFGGAVALLTYLLISEKVKGIILIDALLYMRKLPFLGSLIKIPLVKQTFMYLIPARVKAWVSLKFLFHQGKKIPQEKIEKFTEYMKDRGAYNAFTKTAELLIPHIQDNLETQLYKVKVPVLVIWGDIDPLLPYKHAEKFVRDVPSSKLIKMQNCGHIPQLEYPELTAEHIIDFVKDL